MLTESQLGQMRRDADRLLPDSVTILVPGDKVNEGHGEIQKYVDGDTVKCRFTPKRFIPAATDQKAGDAGQNAELYNVAMPLGTVVTNKHRLRWKGKDYEIVSDVVDRSHQINVRVIVKAIK